MERVRQSVLRRLPRAGLTCKRSASGENSIFVGSVPMRPGGVGIIAASPPPFPLWQLRSQVRALVITHKDDMKKNGM